MPRNSHLPRSRTGTAPQPPVPIWRCLELANLPTLSRFYLLFQPQLLNPWQEGLPSLDRVAFLDEHSPDLPRLPPCPSGWQRFGMVAGTWRLQAPDLGVTLMDTAWAFVFEWQPSVSAWEALLQTQEQLRPEKLALAPQFLLPALFLARMARFPFREDNLPTAWTPVLAEIQTELGPVLHALYVHWMHGPTQAAARYRHLTGFMRSLSQQEQTRLTRFERVASKGTLEDVRQAERLEPLLLRTLEATSTRLWEQPQRVRVDRLVRSLLPLACWRPELPGPVELERLIPQSTQALLPLWRRWQEQGRNASHREPEAGTSETSEESEA